MPRFKKPLQGISRLSAAGGGAGDSDAWFLPYRGESFSVSAQSSGFQSLFFKPDGLKMYCLSFVGDAVYAYTLSTPWDVSTASYASETFSVATQEAQPSGLFFKSDGTKMYVVGPNSDTVYAYNLSTPWVVSSASYASESFSVTSQETSPSGLFFKPDGTQFFIVGATADTIRTYNLATPWLLTGATHANINLSVASQETVPEGLFFKPDGTRVFVVGATNGVSAYDLSTPWLVSSGAFSGETLPLANLDSAPSEVVFKPDGTKAFVMGRTNSRVYAFDL